GRTEHGLEECDRRCGSDGLRTGKVALSLRELGLPERCSQATDEGDHDCRGGSERCPVAARESCQSVAESLWSGEHRQSHTVAPQVVGERGHRLVSITGLLGECLEYHSVEILGTRW